MQLAGLEHLDERYLRAVGYATKSKRGALPKMVLLGDIVGDDEDAVARATSEVVRIANGRSGEGFVAVNADARKKFWLDRSRTAAIARHTNAFKINEDVVIPLDRMGDYTDAIERINIELSFKNKLQLLDELQRDFAGELELGKVDDPDLERVSREELLGDRQSQAQQILAETRARWRYLASISTCRSREALPRLAQLGFEPVRGDFERRIEREPGARVFDLVQDRSIRTSWKSEVRAHLRRLFVGGAFAPVLQAVEDIHKRVLRGRVWIALHMHAGDGNVHTNIPVNSDDYEMLQEANRAVERIMQIARDLDGVISGEHGIGITKLEFLTRRPKPQTSATTRSASIRRVTSIAASSCRAAICATRTRRASICSATSRSSCSSRTSTRSRMRSRIACAAASASRCARRTCRARICSIRRATRSSRRRC